MSKNESVELYEDNKTLLDELMDFNDNGVEPDNDVLKTLIANKLIDKLTSTDSNTLRILGISTKKTRSKIRRLNILSNVFGNPSILEKTKADWLLEDINYKGKGREDMLRILKIISSSHSEEEEENDGVINRVFRR